MVEKRRKRAPPPPPKTFEDDTFVRNGTSKFIKRYKRGKLLGKGGFAVCYEATSYDSGRKYAAKVVHKSNLKKKEKQRKLVNEIHIHRQLDHPHIVKLERHFEDSDHVYILLELCSSITLMEMVKHRGVLTEAETQYFMLQLIDAVIYLHNMNIIHRDLKLGNIFLSESLEVKLGDFGLAALAEGDGRRFSVCGTPNYIAPEVLDGNTKGGHSFEVDIWSLGVIMFTLLCGKPPFETKHVQSTYKKIKKLNYAFPPNIELTSHAKHLISRMLVLDAATRPNLEEVSGHTFFTYRRPLKSLPKCALKEPWKVPTRSRDGPSLTKKRALGTPDTTRSSKRHCPNPARGAVEGVSVTGTPVGFAKEISEPQRPPGEQDAGQENAYGGSTKRPKSKISRNPLKASKQAVADEPAQYDDGFRRPALPSRCSVSPGGKLENNNGLGKPEVMHSPAKHERRPRLSERRRRKDSGQDNLQSIYNEIEESFRQPAPAPRAKPPEKSKPLRPVDAPHATPQVWVCRWVDYARKYGVGYYLTNGCTGVYFNDATKIVLHPDNESLSYVSRGGDSKSDIVEQHTLSDHPPALVKKVMLLKHFKEYLHKEGDLITTEGVFDPKQDLVFVKVWKRTNKSILFRLNDKTVQINFTDNTELVLSSQARLVTYTDKTGLRATYTLKNILSTNRKDLRKRMKYTQEILKTLLEPRKK